MLGFEALRDVTAVMQAFGGLHFERGYFRDLIEELENLLVVVAVQIFLGARTGRDGEKQAPHLRPHVRHELGDVAERSEIRASDVGLNLRIEANVPGMAQRKNRSIIGAVNLSKTVMRWGIWPI